LAAENWPPKIILAAENWPPKIILAVENHVQCYCDRDNKRKKSEIVVAFPLLLFPKESDVWLGVRGYVD
jgi:hypothetical protein